jgi:hypothetical protein
MPATPARRNEEISMNTMTQTHPIRTLREANKIARELGLTRGKGTFNGAAYWKNANGQIVTRDRLAELAGLV